MVAGDLGERVGRGSGIARVDQQPTVPDRGVRRDPPAAQRDRQPQLVDHLVRQQGHEIGVPGQPSLDAGEHGIRDRRAADLLEPFQNQDASPCPREVGSRGQPVVAAADHDRVVLSGNHACPLPSGASA